jgi:hypothetical protein
MKNFQEVSYRFDWGSRREKRQERSSDRPLPDSEDQGVPRVARLMALAIRFEALLRNGTLRDYAELARLGGVTRARITQIMQLLWLAPDIQERILFLAGKRGLKERHLRPIVSRMDWREQRRLFENLAVDREGTRG